LPRTITRKRIRSKPSRKPQNKQIRQRRPSRAHLLIVECDSARLSADGLNIGSALGDLVSGMFPDKRIFVVRTSTEDALREVLAEAFEKYGRFRSILIVGHSNEADLILTEGRRYSWGTVGKWFQIFEPEVLFLAACRAGASVSVRELFKSMNTLRQVYASPITLHKNQTSPLAFLILTMLAAGRIDEGISIASRGASYVVTGGELFRWKRGETGPGRELKGSLWDIVGEFGPRVRNLVASLFSRVGKASSSPHLP